MSSLVDYLNVIITHNYQATCKNLSFAGVQACEMELLQYAANCRDRKDPSMSICVSACVRVRHTCCHKKGLLLLIENTECGKFWQLEELVKIFATRGISESRVCIFIAFLSETLFKDRTWAELNYSRINCLPYVPSEWNWAMGDVLALSLLHQVKWHLGNLPDLSGGIAHPGGWAPHQLERAHGN